MKQGLAQKTSGIVRRFESGETLHQRRSLPQLVIDKILIDQPMVEAIIMVATSIWHGRNLRGSRRGRRLVVVMILCSLRSDYRLIVKLVLHSNLLGIESMSLRSAVIISA